MAAQTLDPNAMIFCTTKLGIAPAKIMATCKLLFEEECTIPFISRYRKEVTGNLDEVQIRDIQESYNEYVETEKRRAFILDAIKKMEALTPELERQIKVATTLTQLEDIYAPYKSKKKTKAMIAKDNGLEPLSEMILKGDKDVRTIIAELEEKFVKPSAGKVKDVQDAINGACDIIMESMAHQLELKEKIRQTFWDSGVMKTGLRKDGDKIEDAAKFKDFFEFSEPLAKLKDPKASHRYMAMRRGMNLKVLKVDAEIIPEVGIGLIEGEFFPKRDKLANYELLKKCAEKSYTNYIQPSLDLEVKNELKKIADTAAISVFGVNLKNLLLQPYLGSKAVLGIDPGVRTGCKVVIVDHTGKFMGDHVVYPHEPKNDKVGAAQILTKMIEMFNVEYIAIGNGTYGRETLEFVETYIPQVKDGKVKATMISEAGASIYSASDIAREEFPDKDVTVRGAVSIARRFQDPLAELVKIDPKSIGVGQYQHDVNQVQLKNNLEAVVESCVNFVGVDLNTASAPLLSYVSGIGPTVAQNVVKYRDANGGFKSRADLLKVTRFTQKVFEQSAGFLRIYNGPHPLDGTFIHPERYPVLEEWVKAHKKDLKDLLTDESLQNDLATDKALKEKIGDITLQDIVKCLKAPSQDPRTTFKSVEFTKGISELKDLKIGQWYNGVVTNIAMFGAFVDIGIKENGLLHISEMSDRFVENALDELKVGQELKVRVLGIDMDRRRISLSCKSDSQTEGVTGTDQGRPRPGKGGGSRPQSQPMQSGPQFKNNAFAGLKGLQLKK
ncbi:Tex family protein [Peredibacter sp. HCB2-198]|uniref:Tex family protein n=1 Tax=Peredibacter sp. HCB2-198 TaxID=3383025 RepID=UPI0038B6A18B